MCFAVNKIFIEHLLLSYSKVQKTIFFIAIERKDSLYQTMQKNFAFILYEDIYFFYENL